MSPSRWLSFGLVGLFGVAALAPGALPVARAEHVAPVAGQAPLDILYEQLSNPAAALGVPSQNYETQYDAFDSVAADDFVIPAEGGISAWEVYTVEVQGQYQSGAQAVVTSTTVSFYVNVNGKPGNLVYSATVTPVGDTSAGNLTLALGSPAILSTGTSYWVAVQANKSLLAGFWRWRERTVLTGQPGQWMNPRNGLDQDCPNWTRMAQCGYTDEPDLLFRLQGNKTANNAPPVLTLLVPNAAANYATNLRLTLEGANFVPNTVVQWTTDNTTDLGVATFVSSQRLEIDVPAGLLTNYGGTATVKVAVPVPCSSTCQSNGLLFRVVNNLYLPLTKR